MCAAVRLHDKLPVQGLAQHDAAAGCPFSQTVPEAAAFTQRLQDVQEEMHLLSCHHYAASFNHFQSPYVRPCTISPLCC